MHDRIFLLQLFLNYNKLPNLENVYIVNFSFFEDRIASKIVYQDLTKWPLEVLFSFDFVVRSSEITIVFIDGSSWSNTPNFYINSIVKMLSLLEVKIVKVWVLISHLLVFIGFPNLTWFWYFIFSLQINESFIFFSF